MLLTKTTFSGFLLWLTKTKTISTIVWLIVKPILKLIQATTKAKSKHILYYMYWLSQYNCMIMHIVDNAICSYAALIRISQSAIAVYTIITLTQ